MPVRVPAGHSVRHRSSVEGRVHRWRRSLPAGHIEREKWARELFICDHHSPPTTDSIWDTVELTDEQQLIRSEIQRICDDFNDEYWRTREAEGEYPHEFASTLAANGWLGVLVPEKYEGAGMGTEEMAVMMEEIAASRTGFGGAQAIHGAIYTSTPLIKYGSEEMKSQLLPKIATGEGSVQSMGLTEPNADSESTAIGTFAERDGGEFVVNSQKI